MFRQQTRKPNAAFNSACQRFAAAHKRTLPRIAHDAGIAEQMLRNKLNPDQTHRLTVDDSIAIYIATGDKTLIDGQLFDCGLTAIEMPSGQTADASLVRTAAVLSSLSGQISAGAMEIATGHRITRTSRDKQVGVAHAAMAALAVYIYQIEQRFAATPMLACATDVLLSMPGVAV